MLPAKPMVADDSAHGAVEKLRAGKFANGDEEKALEIQAEALTVGKGLNGTGKVPLSVGFAKGKSRKQTSQHPDASERVTRHRSELSTRLDFTCRVLVAGGLSYLSRCHRDRLPDSPPSPSAQ